MEAETDMFYIICEGELWGRGGFSEGQAEDWLRKRGWKQEEGGKFVLYKKGRASLFATVEQRSPVRSLADFEKKMSE